MGVGLGVGVRGVGTRASNELHAKAYPKSDVRAMRHGKPYGRIRWERDDGCFLGRSSCGWVLLNAGGAGPAILLRRDKTLVFTGCESRPATGRSSR